MTISGLYNYLGIHESWCGIACVLCVVLMECVYPKTDASQIGQGTCQSFQVEGMLVICLKTLPLLISVHPSLSL